MLTPRPQIPYTQRMSRPTRPIATLTFALLALSFTGCGTVYTRVYSPKKGHFIPVEEKTEVLPPVELLPVDGPATSIQSPSNPPPAALDPVGALPPL